MIPLGLTAAAADARAVDSRNWFGIRNKSIDNFELRNGDIMKIAKSF